LGRSAKSGDAKLFDHVTCDFRTLSTTIKRHENAIVWGN
jgi:hypothetical protein